MGFNLFPYWLYIDNILTEVTKISEHNGIAAIG